LYRPFRTWNAGSTPGIKLGGSVQSPAKSFEKPFHLVMVIPAINYPSVQVAAAGDSKTFKKMLE